MNIYNMKLIHTFLICTTALLFVGQTVHAKDTIQLDTFGSVEERRIANDILQEHANIRKEREDISLHKKELKTLEEVVDKKLAEIDLKLEELKRLQKKIKSLLAEKTAKEKKKLINLANIYQKMSPPKASLAITGLDQKLAAEILANMKVKAAAKILDELSENDAVELSTILSTL
jgi:flagellar motility protein MotE (MotC chaperone)